jgi:hypothetical protein
MMSGDRADEARRHEEGLAVFLRPDRRARFLLSLSDERLRRKVGQRLHHHADDFAQARARVLKRHAKHGAFIGHVHEQLSARGAPAVCFVYAPDHEWDGAQVDLLEALEQYLTYGDAIISCVPGELALYVGEDGHPVLLLVRSERRSA